MNLHKSSSREYETSGTLLPNFLGTRWKELLKLAALVSGPVFMTTLLLVPEFSAKSDQIQSLTNTTRQSLPLVDKRTSADNLHQQQDEASTEQDLPTYQDQGSLAYDYQTQGIQVSQSHRLHPEGASEDIQQGHSVMSEQPIERGEMILMTQNDNPLAKEDRPQEDVSEAILEYLDGFERALENRIALLTTQSLQQTGTSRTCTALSEVEASQESKQLSLERVPQFAENVPSDLLPPALDEFGPFFAPEKLSDPSFQERMRTIRQKERSYYLLLTRAYTPQALTAAYRSSSIFHQSVGHYGFLPAPEVSTLFMIGEMEYLLQQSEVDGSRVTVMVDGLSVCTTDQSVPQALVLLELLRNALTTSTPWKSASQKNTLIQATVRYLRTLPEQRFEVNNRFQSEKQFFEGLHGQALVEGAKTRLNEVFVSARTQGAEGYASLTRNMSFHQLLAHMRILKEYADAQEYVSIRQNVLELLRSMQRVLVSDEDAKNRVDERLLALEQLQ